VIDIISSMRLLRLLSLLLLACSLSGCTPSPQGQSQPPTQAPTPLTEFPTDDLGRTIALKAPAKRVVSIGPGATEAIFALNAQDRLVGRDQISDYPAQTAKIPEVGDYTGPFVEKVIAVKPDLVIVQGETYDKARAENWQQKIGVPVAILVPTSVDKVDAGIEKIATWLGATENLNAVTKAFPSRLKAPGYKTDKSWTVFYEVDRSPLWTAGKGTLIDSQLEALGWKNVAADVESYKAFNVETLLKRDPDFYIVTMAKPDREKALRELRSTPALKNLTAIKEGRVLVVEADLVLRPSPRLPLGIQALARELAALTKQEKNTPAAQ
jgi:iron complex transport system substrate-binding protein